MRLSHITLLCFYFDLCWTKYFQIMNRKQVSGVFETRLRKSVLECAASCVQNAQASGSCVSANFNGGRHTCAFSNSSGRGSDLIDFDDDGAMVLIPPLGAECGTFENTFRNTEAVVGDPLCTTEDCTLYIQCKPGFKQHPGSTDPVLITCSSDGNWTSTSPTPNCSYELMFRGTAENGFDINAAYLYGNVLDGVTSDVTCMDVHNTSCSLHYRNSRIDSWTTLGMGNILYELYSGGVTVISVVFDGTGSDMTTWMGNDAAFKATSWPWTDMTPSTTSWWSLFNNADTGRSFRILQNYGGDCMDTYFSVVLYEPSWGCDYENHTSWPRILYSDKSGSLNFKTEVYQQASSMAVWVQSSN